VGGGGGGHHTINPTIPTHGHFVLSLVLVASGDRGGGPAGLMIYM